jgi:hypothetical protein
MLSGLRVQRAVSGSGDSSSDSGSGDVRRTSRRRVFNIHSAHYSRTYFSPPDAAVLLSIGMY